MSPSDPRLDFLSRKSKRVESQTELIKLINQDLKLSGVLCRLRINKGNLFIRYQDLDGKRREISPPNCDISQLGIAEAQKLSALISQALRLRNYSQDWLDLEILRKTEKVSPIILTAGSVRDRFPDLWLKYRSGDKESTDRQKLVTLYRYEVKLKRLYKLGKIDDSTPFDAKLITRLLALFPEHTDLKFRAKETLSIVCTVYGITYSFKGIGKRGKSTKRAIPTDLEIIGMYEKFDRLTTRHVEDSRIFYQWVYGLIATYGLRPQEVFAIDWEKSFKAATHNWLFLDGTLCDGIKTGNRIVPPLLPEWIELFDLKKLRTMKSESANLSRRASMISRFWTPHKIGCVPYDLRHAYAIRGHRLGKSVVVMARAMGHDVTTHTRIYQRWISIEDQIESFNRTN
jgi:integrase